MIQGNPEPPFEQKILKELRKWLRKMVLLQGYVSGMYRCLGALMGPPMVRDG